jgi:CDP-L-myo-inositol myo-inositolphosphotransferase
MQAIILAAGLGTRLYPLTQDLPKGLLKVAGGELLLRHLYLLSQEGIDDFILVVNEKTRPAFEKFLKHHSFPCHLVINPHPERGNGYSFYLAKDLVKGPFVLTMSDHVYEPEFVRQAVRLKGLVFDEAGRFIDPEEATKVLCEGGCLKAIGKDLAQYHGFDTGFFVLEPSIFDVAEELVSAQEVVSLSEIVSRARLPCSPLSGFFWTDIDTPEELSKATRGLVKTTVKGHGDGLVSRLLNRRVSTFCSSLLVDKISPNQATLFTFFLGLLAAVVAFFCPWGGGLLYQLSSMLDGMDGEIARATLRTSAFGGWLDSVLDRIVDFTFLLALAYHASFADPRMFAIILSAIFGSFMVSYTTERYRGAFKEDAYQVLKALRFLPGKRDERVFLIMLFCLARWLEELFVLLAVITNLRVALTIWLVWKNKGKALKAH